MAGKPSASSGIAALVERRMRDWVVTGPDVQAEPATSRALVKPNFYIAISRESGCQAEELAQVLAAMTGFQKFDKEILDYMVAREDVRRKLYETLDDQAISWIEDVCSSLAIGPAVDEAQYFKRLSHALLAICHNTHAIFLGRAAGFILAPADGLSIRLVAPLEFRIQRFAAAAELDSKTAQQRIKRIDQGRSGFVKHHFGKNAQDPQRYDMVINTSKFPMTELAEVIITAVRAKAGPSLKLPVQATTDTDQPT